MKRAKKIKIPDFNEFVDEDGIKWIQTSTEDLFSVKEINEILESVEREKEEGKEEIVLARIDFQNVNKEYYEKVIELQAKLKKRDDLLRKLLVEVKQVIDKKSSKLRELIEYIRKIHTFLAYYKLDPKKIQEIGSITGITYETEVRETDEQVEEVKIEKIRYTDVEEIILDEDGNESGTS